MATERHTAVPYKPDKYRLATDRKGVVALKINRRKVAAGRVARVELQHDFDTYYAFDYGHTPYYVSRGFTVIVHCPAIGAGYKRRGKKKVAK